MAKRLSGRQVLNLIFDDESNPEYSESSDGENRSSGSEYQVESDGSDQQEESKGDDIDMENSEASKSDDVFYSLADNPDMRHKTEEDRLVTASFPEVRWRSDRPVHQLRVRLELRMSRKENLDRHLLHSNVYLMRIQLLTIFSCSSVHRRWIILLNVLTIKGAE